MTKDNKNVIHHFEALLDWAQKGLKQPNLPYTYYQYMKLKETLESVIDSLLCVVSTAENLPLEHRGNGLRIVVDNSHLDKLRSHQDKIKVSLPML